MIDKKTALLTRIAELYFERELSQKEIADMLELSRPMVSRLIAEARENGIVSIKINRPIEKREDLAKGLLDAFDLKEAIVVSGSEVDTASKNLGVATAELLATILRDDSIVGVSWGRDLYQAVNSLQALSLKGCQVTQLAGGLGEGDAFSDGPEIARVFGQKLNAPVRYLYAPTVVQSRETKTELLSQTQLAQTITLASQVDVALTGIGSLEDKGSSLSKAGYISEKSRKAFIKQGGQAHLLGYVLDSEGVLLEDPHNEQVVAIPIQYLQRAKWAIGIASSSEKAKAIKAALQAGHFNTVVLSEDVAENVLKLINKPQLHLV